MNCSVVENHRGDEHGSKSPGSCRIQQGCSGGDSGSSLSEGRLAWPHEIAGFTGEPLEIKLAEASGKPRSEKTRSQEPSFGFSQALESPQEGKMAIANRVESVVRSKEDAGGKIMHHAGPLFRKLSQLRIRTYPPRLSRVSSREEYGRYFEVKFRSPANGHISPQEKCWRLAHRKRPSKYPGIKEKYVCFAREQRPLGTRY